jgi:hypothetical protein
MQILVNHVGYETGGPKKAVLMSGAGPLAQPLGPVSFRVLEAATGTELLAGKARFVGRVDSWKDWVFWTADFSSLRRPGRCFLETTDGSRTLSPAFDVGDGLLLSGTVPAVLSYFRSQRCGGEMDQADRQVPFFGGRPGRVDVHGGWYDASGDRSKYLSHLSYANFMNPQQAPLVVWSLLAARDMLAARDGRTAPEVPAALLEEALYGAEFLQRMQDPAGYFYIGVFDRWTKDPALRQICSFRTQKGDRGGDYQAGWRQGGGMAIAALARASAVAPPAQAEGFRRAAETGFAHLQKHGTEYLDDHRENVIDDYCALLAASELHAACGGTQYLPAARERARSLAGRLSRDARCTDFWAADGRGERPYFHAAEAGLPAIALLRYAEVESAAVPAASAREAAGRSLRCEMRITAETANPFGLARQYVKPVDGPPRTAFFFPHHNESGYWWQGENARLASLAAAARMAVRGLPADGDLAPCLEYYAASQIDWILGCNPYDVCMLHGFGRNNPEYEERWPNAHGGICNGITGGFADERDIDFLPAPAAALGEHRWRWSEQWLPHAAWYLLAVCAGR